MKKDSFYKNHLSIFLLSGIILGSITGLLWPNASALKPLGTIYINAMFCVVVPLVFFSISSSIANMESGRRTSKILSVTIALFALTAIIAALFMLTALKLFPLTVSNYPEVAANNDVKLDVSSLLVNFLTQPDFPQLISKNAILPLIAAAIIFGFAIQKNGGAESPAAKLFKNLSDCSVGAVKIINCYAPIGFFGFFANLVSELGTVFLADYGRLVITYYLVAALYFAVFSAVYAYWGAGIRGVKMMYRHITRSMVVAFGTSSSVAAMPVNLEQAKDSGVSPEVSSLVIPMGTTMHMDGIALTTVLKIIFLSQMFEMRFSYEEAVLAVAVAILASVASPAIPGGGNTGSVILCTVFFPEQFAIAYPIAASIGNMVDPISTMVNASLDYVATFIVERYVNGKNWLKKYLARQ